MFPITVIIATYKKFEFLQDAINSVFMQDYPSIELIISDDGSPNFSQESVENLVKNPPVNISDIQIIHHKTNLGTIKNLNHAIRQSKGYYISLLGGDDLYYESTTLSKMITQLKDQNVIVGNAVMISESNEIIKAHYSTNPFISKFLPTRLLYFKIITLGNQYIMPSSIFKKSFLESLNLFNEQFKYVEDLEFWYRMFRKGYRIVTCDQITVKYRTNGVSSLESEFYSIMAKESYDILMNEIQYINESTLWGKFTLFGITQFIKNELILVDEKNFRNKFSKSNTLVFLILFKVFRKLFHVFSPRHK